GVAGFRTYALAEGSLDIDIPADRIRIEGIRIVERDALAKEGIDAESRPGRLLNPRREWIIECHRRAQIAGSGGAQHRAAGAEARRVDALRSDRRNEPAPAGANHCALT